MSAKELLDAVEDYFYFEAHECRDCPHYTEWRESRGEFWGIRCSETLCQCGALEKDNPYLCPALEDAIQRWEHKHPSEAEES